MVTIRLFAAAKSAAGGISETTADVTTLAAALAHLENAHGPSLAKVLSACSYLVDGLAVHGDPAEAVLAPGSTVDVLPPFAGG